MRPKKKNVEGSSEKLEKILRVIQTDPQTQKMEKVRVMKEKTNIALSIVLKSSKHK